jgi:hypothetical protein
MFGIWHKHREDWCRIGDIEPCIMQHPWYEHLRVIIAMYDTEELAQTAINTYMKPRGVFQAKPFSGS